MPTKMTVAEFRQRMLDEAQARTGLDAYSRFLAHKTREDKYLREQHLPILAVVNYKNMDDAAQIELGNERDDFDARLAGAVFEVVQALPADEHEIRREVASGGASPGTYMEHANDHLQFPGAIIAAITTKHDKRYADDRSLVVVFDGDYSFEDDEIVHRWVREIRQATILGTFKEILLVELSRLKVFPVY